MEHPLLIENEAKRLNIRLPLLICFGMFSAWQMGMVYFSGNTLSVDGRTPLPVNIGNVTVLITVGYVLSIIVMILKPDFTIWAERIAALAALISTLMLFLPLSPEILAFALYIQFFCCIFMIGFETAIIVGLFTERTAVLHLSLAYGIVQFFTAVLHNEFFRIQFHVFRLFSVIAIFMMVIFFFKIPGNIWPRPIKKIDGLAAPKTLFTGILLLTGMCCFLALFGNAVAERVRYGVFVLYSSAGVSGIFVFLFWNYLGFSPFNIYKVLVAMGAIGFILQIASLYVPVLSLAACAFLGGGISSCWLAPLIGNLLHKWYPSKFISPAIIGTALLTVLVHSLLVKVFRENPAASYVAYLVIALTIVILYLLLEPYLFFSFKNRSLTKGLNLQGDEKFHDIDEKLINSVKQQSSELSKTLKALTLDDLSYQELRIAELSLKGHTYAEIATALNIKLNTVRWYMKSIYTKLQINSKAELFHLAFKREVRSE